MQQLLGVDLGAPGEPVGPVLQAFERRGIRISRRTLAGLRAGTASAEAITARLAWVDRLRANDASLKNQRLLAVIQAGLACRRSNGDRSRRLYSPVGLSAGMQTALGLSQKEFNLVVLVMRADLGIATIKRWDDDLVSQFRKTAATFLRVHRRPRLAPISTNDYVNAAWDQQTIHGFYFALHEVAAPRGRWVWFPYELDLLQRFYAKQQALGNGLTPLDRLVLAGGAARRPRVKDLHLLVRAQLGIDYDCSCVAMHRRLLATGSLTPAAAGEGQGFSPASPGGAGEGPVGLTRGVW